MNVLLFICFLFFIFLQGCHQPPSSTNEDEFKNYVNVNSNVNSDPPSAVVNSSTSIAQPDAQQPVTLGNVAF
jgi:hypothetical protein